MPKPKWFPSILGTFSLLNHILVVISCYSASRLSRKWSGVFFLFFVHLRSDSSCCQQQLKDAEVFSAGLVPIPFLRKLKTWEHFFCHVQIKPPNPARNGVKITSHMSTLLSDSETSWTPHNYYGSTPKSAQFSKRWTWLSAPYFHYINLVISC